MLLLSYSAYIAPTSYFCSLLYTSLHRLLVLPERSLMKLYHLSEMHIAWLSTISLHLLSPMFFSIRIYVNTFTTTLNIDKY